LDFGELIGTPSIYDVNIEPLPLNRWKVVVSFVGAPDGEIAFECDNISFSADEGTSHSQREG